MRKYSCGEVIFMREGHYVQLMGAPRVAALRAAYRREPLPDGLVMCARVGALTEIKWDDVYWLTCGRQVHDGMEG